MPSLPTFTRLPRTFALLLALLLSALLSACSSAKPKGASPGEISIETRLFQQAQQAYREQNYPKAASLLQPLAQQGHADAQYALGFLLYYGLGVPPQPDIALKWFAASAQQGNTKAQSALRLLQDPKPAPGAQKPANKPQQQQPSQQPVIDLRKR